MAAAAAAACGEQKRGVGGGQREDGCLDGDRLALSSVQPEQQQQQQQQTKFVSQRRQSDFHPVKFRKGMKKKSSSFLFEPETLTRSKLSHCRRVSIHRLRRRRFVRRKMSFVVSVGGSRASASIADAPPADPSLLSHPLCSATGNK